MAIVICNFTLLLSIGINNKINVSLISYIITLTKALTKEITKGQSL
jgi:hypothetical protein